jgi:hypothetical protein
VELQNKAEEKTIAEQSRRKDKEEKIEKGGHPWVRELKDLCWRSTCASRAVPRKSNAALGN